MRSHSRPRSEPEIMLPPRANLEHLKNEAKSALKDLQQTDPSAQLASAQLIVARKYGFSSWRSLRSHFSDQLGTLDIDQSGYEVSQRRYEQFRPRKAVPIDPKLLDSYVGHFELQPRLICSITREEDHLCLRLTGQQPVRLSSEGERKFFHDSIPGGLGIPFQISFAVDAGGSAKELILHQSGHNQPAKRISDVEASAIAEELVQRRKANRPLAGSEAALRGVIDGELSGKPDYSQMTKALALVAAPQSPFIQKELAELGEFRSLKFKAVDRDGADVFEATFAKGGTEWWIRLGQNEKIVGLFFRVLL